MTRRIEVPGELARLAHHFLHHLEREALRIAEDSPLRQPHPDDLVILAGRPADLPAMTNPLQHPQALTQPPLGPMEGAEP